MGRAAALHGVPAARSRRATQPAARRTQPTAVDDLQSCIVYSVRQATQRSADLGRALSLTTTDDGLPPSTTPPPKTPD